MKKDIVYPKVKDVAVAIVLESGIAEKQKEWNVYLINFKGEPLTGVLVSSRGYGEKDGEQVKTSTLRRFLDTLPAESFCLIEPIMEDLFGLNNEYWVSFKIGDLMYDKKYIFVPETVVEKNLQELPFIGKKGVMIK